MILLICFAIAVFVEKAWSQAAGDTRAWGTAARARQAARWDGYRTKAFSKSGTGRQRAAYRTGNALWWTGSRLTSGTKAVTFGFGRALRAGAAAVKDGEARKAMLAAEAKYGPGVRAVKGAAAEKVVDPLRARFVAKREVKAATKQGRRRVNEIAKAVKGTVAPEPVPYPYASSHAARNTGGAAVGGWTPRTNPGGGKSNLVAQIVAEQQRAGNQVLVIDSSQVAGASHPDWVAGGARCHWHGDRPSVGRIHPVGSGGPGALDACQSCHDGIKRDWAEWEAAARRTGGAAVTGWTPQIDAGTGTGLSPETRRRAQYLGVSVDEVEAGPDPVTDDERRVLYSMAGDARLTLARQTDTDTLDWDEGHDTELIKLGIDTARDDGNVIDAGTAQRIAAQFQDGSRGDRDLIGGYASGGKTHLPDLLGHIRGERAGWKDGTPQAVMLDELYAHLAARGYTTREESIAKFPIRDSGSLADYLNEHHRIGGYEGGDPNVKAQQPDEMPDWMFDGTDPSDVVRTPEGYEARYDPDAQEWESVYRTWHGQDVDTVDDGDAEPYWGVNANDLPMFNGGSKEPTREEKASAERAAFDEEWRQYSTLGPLPKTPEEFAKALAAFRAGRASNPNQTAPADWPTYDGTAFDGGPNDPTREENHTAGPLHPASAPADTDNPTQGDTTMTSTVNVAGEATGISSVREILDSLAALGEQTASAIDSAAGSMQGKFDDETVGEIASIVEDADRLAARAKAVRAAMDARHSGGEEYAKTGHAVHDLDVLKD